jgi:hypothetical protein
MSNNSFRIKNNHRILGETNTYFVGSSGFLFPLKKIMEKRKLLVFKNAV